MKYLFALLLLANVVFYLWETNQRERPEVVSQELELPPNAERIVLLAELPAIPKKPLPTLEAPAEPTPAPPVEAPPPSEVPPPQAEPPQAQSEPGCYWLGPYENEAEARKIRAALPPDLKGAEVVRRSGTTPDGYWVMYPKAPSMEIARVNRQMLQDKGVRDLWLFDKGEWQGAISLGLFKTRERAEQALQHYREQNIAVEIQPRLLRAEKPWVKFHWPGDRAELDDLLGDQAGSVEPCP